MILVRQRPRSAGERQRQGAARQRATRQRAASKGKRSLGLHRSPCGSLLPPVVMFEVLALPGKAQPKGQPKPLVFGKRLNLKDSGALPQTARGGPQEPVTGTAVNLSA